MNHTMQFGRRPKGDNSSDFLPLSDTDEDLDEFDDLVEEEEEDLAEEESLDEELDFDKPHFHRLGLDYEEEDEE